MRIFWRTFVFLCLPILTACWNGSSSNMMTIDLSGRWEFRKAGDTIWLEASVPGTVHTDLYKNVLIADPFDSDNEKNLQWIDKENWEYRKTFPSDPRLLRKDKLILSFDGLDTYAEVILNGQVILNTDNMFRSWEVDIKDLIRKKGLNDLRVNFTSPIEAVKAHYDSLPYHYPAANDRHDEKYSVFTRKAPYHYGWDWGPRFVTSGIWRPVSLVAWDNARIESLYYKQKLLSDTSCILDVELEISALKNCQARITVRMQNDSARVLETKQFSLKNGSNLLTVPIEIRNPKKWWPNGLGEAFLYELITEIKIGSETLSASNHIGLRTIDLVREKDQWGESFYFKVNGVPLFVKGANYIPQDNFLNHVMPTEYSHLLHSAREANMNMIRVWGGGVYEDDLFYHLCDRMGLLVWQDFMFACSMYPGNTEFLASIEAEAEDNIKRLRNHPSLAIWCGNNEIQDAWHQWGWQNQYSEVQKKEIAQSYQAIFHELLPEMVSKFDPQREYWPSSPASGTAFGQTSNTKSGDLHYWGVWHSRLPFETYGEVIPRFSSEFGFQSFPEYKTICSFTLPDERDIESEVMKAHQKHPAGNELILNYMERYYPVPEDFEEFLYVSQVMQGEGIRFGLEALRRSKPRCMGSLYWQLNDCWPAASWSGIDYFGRWKALHFQAQRAYEPLLISFQQDQDSLQVYLVSDLREEIAGKLSLQLMAFDGRIWYHKEMNASFSPLKSIPVIKISTDDMMAGNISPEECFVVAKFSPQDQIVRPGIHYFEKARDQKLPDVIPEWELLEKNGNMLLKLSSPSLCRQVYIRYDGETEIRFHENYFDLLPNEVKIISIHKREREEINSDKIRIFVLNQLSPTKPR
jgi:beta-mannosidase